MPQEHDEPWTFDGLIRFVRGVDEHGAEPPPGYPYRFAVLSWFDYGPDFAAPWPLARTAIPRVAKLVGATEVVCEYWQRHVYGFWFLSWSKETKIREESWEQVIAPSDEVLHEDGEFPHRFRFIAQDQTLLHAESDFWSLIGGPQPYHDSVTLSFFSRQPLDDALQQIFVEEAQALGVLVDPG